MASRTTIRAIKGAEGTWSHLRGTRSARRWQSSQATSTTATAATSTASSSTSSSPSTADSSLSESPNKSQAIHPGAGQQQPKPQRSAKDILIKPLARPLGVELPPVSSPQTYRYQSEEWFDTERNRLERKALMKEASHGYYHDYHKIHQVPGNKRWLAPRMLIREDMSLYFPNIAGYDLNGKQSNTTDMLEGKISVVAITSTQISGEHTTSYIRPVLDDHEGNPDFNYVQINHQQNYLKAVLVAMFASSMKRQVDPSLWDKYLVTRGEWSQVDIVDPMGIENKIIGYVFLVDANYKIRWAACGYATDEEVASLRAATAVLLQRHKLHQGR